MSSSSQPSVGPSESTGGSRVCPRRDQVLPLNSQSQHSLVPSVAPSQFEFQAFSTQCRSFSERTIKELRIHSDQVLPHPTINCSHCSVPSVAPSHRAQAFLATQCRSFERTIKEPSMCPRRVFKRYRIQPANCSAQSSVPSVAPKSI
jgi:hypothetical protein